MKGKGIEKYFSDKYIIVHWFALHGSTCQNIIHPNQIIVGYTKIVPCLLRLALRTSSITHIIVFNLYLLSHTARMPQVLYISYYKSPMLGLPDLMNFEIFEKFK